MKNLKVIRLSPRNLGPSSAALGSPHGLSGQELLLSLHAGVAQETRAGEKSSLVVAAVGETGLQYFKCPRDF